MSPVADSTLFDGNFSSAVNHLMHLPETLEKLVFSPNGHGHGHHHNHGGKIIAGDVPVDILETPDGYTFFLDVPGLSKSYIQVTVEDETILVIRSNGKRKREDGEEEGCKYLRLERKASSPKFLRKFRLPEDSNTSAISAKCQNGVLTVTVEKLPPPEKKFKTVEVAVA